MKTLPEPTTDNERIARRLVDEYLARKGDPVMPHARYRSDAPPSVSLTMTAKQVKRQGPELVDGYGLKLTVHDSPSWRTYFAPRTYPWVTRLHAENIIIRWLRIAERQIAVAVVEALNPNAFLIPFDE